MVEFKLTINDVKNGKSYKKVLESNLFKNKKIGDVVQGDDLGLKGYELEISGGSDKSGFPMRKDLSGGARRKAFLSKGVGMKKNRKGLRLKKSVCGNLINVNTSQINLRVTKYGGKKIEDVFGKKEEKPAEVKEEAKVEEKKEVKEEKKEVEVKPKEEKEEIKEEKPAEEVKEEK